MTRNTQDRGKRRASGTTSEKLHIPAWRCPCACPLHTDRHVCLKPPSRAGGQDDARIQPLNLTMSLSWLPLPLEISQPPKKHTYTPTRKEKQIQLLQGACVQIYSKGADQAHCLGDVHGHRLLSCIAGSCRIARIPENSWWLPPHHGIRQSALPSNSRELPPYSGTSQGPHTQHFQ